MNPPGVPRAFLAAVWGLTAGISGCMLFLTDGFMFIYALGWCMLSVAGAIVNAAFVNLVRQADR